MPVAWLLQDGVADYLKSLPIPRSFGDIKELSLKDYLHLTFFFGATGGEFLGCFELKFLFLQRLLTTWDRKSAHLTDKTLPSNSPAIRSSIPSSKISSHKIVFQYLLSRTEGIDGKAVYCRCWKSAKFPYCDGAHNKYNKETGDNLGPLIISKE
jgi:CDGSH-type Zn-finger protein